jgi:hypothetical protein
MVMLLRITQPYGYEIDWHQNNMMQRNERPGERLALRISGGFACTLESGFLALFHSGISG